MYIDVLLLLLLLFVPFIHTRAPTYNTLVRSRILYSNTVGCAITFHVDIKPTEQSAPIYMVLLTRLSLSLGDLKSAGYKAIGWMENGSSIRILNNEFGIRQASERERER